MDWVDVLYNILTQDWVADWREYTLDDYDFERVQEHLEGRD